MKKKILCIGQSAYDITLPLNGFPTENKKVKIIDKRYECGGGSANNSAYLLGLWGSNVTLLSSIGNDYQGKLIKKELESVNVKTKYLNINKNNYTNTSYIISNLLNGTRTIITNKNTSNKYNKDFNIKFKPDIILNDGNEKDLCIKLIKKYKDCISILDAGNSNPDTIELCKYVDYIVCSNDFAKDYTKQKLDYDDINTIKKCYDIIYNDFKKNVIITLEDRGCFTKIDDEYILVPSIKVKAVDSTGAGDIFHGAFTYFISKGYDLKKALRLSNITGALSVQKLGSKNSMPDLEDVLKYE